MSDTSKIEWTEATWNPIVGCTAVSPGCDNCYAAREASGRLSVLPLYAGLAKGGVFSGEVRLVPERLDQPLRWKRPRRVFVNSMSDLFHDGVPTEFIAEVFAVMALSKRHTFQVLTKRHARLRSVLNQPNFQGLVCNRIWKRNTYAHPPEWPLPNVWLGVSVEDQKWADIRISALLNTPAAVRWLSCEPLLGPVDLYQSAVAPLQRFPDEPNAEAGRIDWVVVGGESGPRARPMDPAWALNLRDQCTKAGVPFFFKQWGEWVRPDHMTGDTFMDWDVEHGSDAYGRDKDWRVGKKRAGRLLDGVAWDEYPAA